MLAFSKADLRAKFKKFLKSFFDEEPEPSAMLLDTDIPEPLNCSAKRYNFFPSRSSAILKSSSVISIADYQIFKS